MKKLLLLGAVLAGGSLCLPASFGHGGTYRGPGDTVPPGGGGAPGGAGPGTPGPGAPGTPGPSAPGTPGPAAPGTPAGAPAGGAQTPTTGGVTDSGPDLTRWEFWWGFNKDPYLNLKSKIHDLGVATGSDNIFIGRGEQTDVKDSLRPTEEQIRDVVVPALKRALEKERSNDILTGSLIALAKIGDVQNESGDSEFQQLIVSFLADGTQEVAETAAVALGILADERSIELLVDLMNDGSMGRKAVGNKSEVPYRTRAFAAYGLGLIGNRVSDNEQRQLIAEHLIDVLNAPEFAQRDIKVAAMNALGLTPVDPLPSDAEVPELSEEEAASNRRHVLSRQAQLKFLMGYFDEANQRANATTRHWFVRAHVPAAMGRLLQDAGPDCADIREECRDMLLKCVDKRSKYSQKELKQSAALALGQVCNAHKDDVKAMGALEDLAKDTGDQQIKRFALIALAQAGGTPVPDDELGTEGVDVARKALFTQLARGKSSLKPWAALACGVFGRKLVDNEGTIEPSSALALRAAAKDCKSPEQIGAYVLGLGIRRDVESRDLVLQKMEYFNGNDEAVGYCAVALGLMEDRTSIDPIQKLIQNSKYRPELLKQAAVGLGLLGDKELVPELIDMLGSAKGLATQAAISSALGAIGDQRSIDPLVAMLDDKGITDTARGFSAVALGIVCDKEDFPWNSKVGVNINYRANTVTLTGEGGTGILDIL